MSFLSMKFLMFLTVAVLGYYAIPKRFQWVWLLLFSYLFYLASGPWAAIFILTTTMTTFWGGLCLECTDRRLGAAMEQNTGKERAFGSGKKALKAQYRNYKKGITAAVLIINFGILALLKYRNFAVENVNQLLRTSFAQGKLLLPLGISFYTFQSMGYLIDVYRGKYAPDRNPLFVSFFPQILQGPIGRYDRLGAQLFGHRTFSLTRIERGTQKMLWGYFKKIVIADRAGGIVNQVFGHYEAYTGITVMRLSCATPSSSMGISQGAWTWLWTLRKCSAFPWTIISDSPTLPGPFRISGTAGTLPLEPG